MKIHPKYNKCIEGVTICSGLGGGTIGLLMNFINELFAIDNWLIAQKAFEANFKDDRYIPFWLADILTISADDILRKALLAVRQLDIMLISAPCQGFSTSNSKSNPLDPRNALFLKGITLIAGVLPKCFIIENVPGMYDPKNVAIFNEVKHRLKELLMPHYEIKCYKLCALNYGVPQNRNRLIYIGYLKSLGKIPTPPIPDFEAKEHLRIVDVTPEITAIKVGQSKKIIKSNTKYMNTIMASGGTTVFVNGKEQPLSNEQNRKYATLPDWYVMPDEISAADAQELYGNIIPPKFMEAIVAHILDEIGDQLGSMPA